jgi:hypothetical protein
LQLFQCKPGTVRILPFHQKRTNACSSLISGSERLDSQANSARKAGWSFPIVYLPLLLRNIRESKTI